MRKVLLAALAVGVLLTSRTVCPAQEPAELKPVAAVSVSGYDRILSAVRFISPPSAVTLEDAVKSFTDGRGLEGLDQSRPWGFLVRTDGQQFFMHAFVPVTDLKKLLTALEPAIGEAEEMGEGVYQIETEDRIFHVKQVGEWAFLSLDPAALKEVPEKPAEALGDLPKNYDLGLRFTVKNIPPLYRQMLLVPLEAAGQQGLEKRDDETDEEHELRTKVFRQSMQQLSTMLDELDTAVVGIKIDEKERIGAMEYAVTAVEGTKLARQMAQTGELKTDYAGFFTPDAALKLVTVARIGEAEIEQVKTSLATAKANALEELGKQDLSEKEMELAKKLVSELIDVLQKTVEGGKLDVAAAAKVSPDALTAAAGGHVVEPQRVEEALKAMAKQLSEDEPEHAGAIKLNAEEFQGVRFHTVTVPLAEVDEAEAFQKLVGDSLTIVFGVGKESLYLAAGRDAVDMLKQAMEKSKAEPARTVPPMQFKLALAPIAKTVAAVADDPQVASTAGMISEALEGNATKDHVTVTATTMPNGTKTRVELEEGVLRLLGALPPLLMGMGGGF